MNNQDYISCYYSQSVSDLPFSSCKQCKYYPGCEGIYREILGEDPCGGRECDACEIGGCNHGVIEL